MKKIFFLLFVAFSVTACNSHDYQVRLTSKQINIVAISQYIRDTAENVIVAFELDKNLNPYPGIDAKIVTNVPITNDTILTYAENGEVSKYLFANGKVLKEMK